MPITALPTPPTPTDTPAAFNSKSFALLGALPSFVTEANSQAATVSSDAAATALAAAATATNAAAAIAAAVAAGAVAFVPGASYAIGNARYSLVNFATYRARTSGIKNTDPANDATGWAGVAVSSVNGEFGAVVLKTVAGESLSGAGDIVPGLPRSARTANAALGLADKGRLIDLTANTFTQTFVAAATLGDGWWCYLRNSGTGDITLDPNASELIDGLTSFVMYPSEVRLVQCDGTVLRSVVLCGFSRTFVTGGTFVRPPGYAQFAGLAYGAGGSGAKPSSGGAGGGGGGACLPFLLAASTLGVSQTVAVGAGAFGATSNDSSGTGGGNTSLGALVVAYGGGGGRVSSSAGYGGGGGGALSAGVTGSTSTIALGGQPFTGLGIAGHFGGGNGAASTTAAAASAYGGGGGGGGSSGNPTTGPGGSSVYGGGGGGGVYNSVTSLGGLSPYGGSGGASGGSGTSGEDGAIPGGGGGATASGAKAGDGARSELRIRGIV